MTISSLELNSAVGTMDTPEEEEKLAHFLAFLTHHQETIKDYRSWLQEKGVTRQRIDQWEVQKQ